MALRIFDGFVGPSQQLLGICLEWRRGLLILAAFLLQVALCGCASTASGILDRKALDSPEIHQASGNLHREVFGLHFITTFSLIKEGAEPPGTPFFPVYSIHREDWSVIFLAPGSICAQASAWFAEHDTDMPRDFDTMLEVIRPAFPGTGARRFVVYVLPPRSRVDLAWPQVATSDKDLLLAYALRLPSPGQDNTETILNVSLVLAHEFSHSYFWFHREHYINNFSDEVIAYSIQRCLSVRLFGGSHGDLPAEYDELASQVAHLAPGEIYRRFHEEYADSYLANVVSAIEFRRVEAMRRGRSEEALKDYCRAIPTSGRDFTRAEP